MDKKWEEKWSNQDEQWKKQEERQDERIADWEKQEAEREKEIADREKQRSKKKFHLTGSLPAKIITFFLLAITCFTGVGTAVLCMYLESEEFYTSDLNTVLAGTLGWMGRNTAEYVDSLLNRGMVKEAEEYCRSGNIDVELVTTNKDGSLEVIWSTWDGDGTAVMGNTYTSFGEMNKNITINGYTLKSDEMYLYRYYINPEFPIEDECQRMADLITFLYDARFALIGFALGSIFLCSICFIFLMCSAGHRNGKEGIIPGVLTGIHLDVLTLFFAGAVVIFCMITVETISFTDDWIQLIVMVAAGTLLLVWATIYCMELALRMKLGKCWRHSLIYVTFKGIGKALRFLCRGTGMLIRGIPLMLTVLTAYFGICILEFLGVLVFMRSSAAFFLWALEKVVLLAVVMYVAMVCNKLLEAGKALAEGEENYTVDTSRMFGDFKEHGENLNSLSQGISRAVAERMKSEHLKTELISNVSHDLKTPLTSIINYADLISEEAGSETSADLSRVKEYSEVLLRQSRRLKKLLEDLMEASKATTGNLEVNLETCEVGVLLSQAVGEYQQRMEEKGLELITRQPQEEVRILADGRHLWRVFDNLLNNICKYAQENSRVYLSIETDREYARIIFRNMSKYALETSAEELQERFVRGDKSRHMEGNGLGLSIAKSLVELQNGKMDIVIDGDLFKVTVSFPL